MFVLGRFRSGMAVKVSLGLVLLGFVGYGSAVRVC